MSSLVCVGEHAPERGAARWIMVGQGLFVLMAAACIALDPTRAAVVGGLSYYGTQLRTAVLFGGGFLLAIGASMIGLGRLQASSPRVRRFRHAAGLIVVLMLPIPLTPYSINVVFDWVHTGAAILLFSLALAVGGWFASTIIRSPAGRLLFAAQIGAAGAIFAAEAGLQEYMLPSELVFQLVITALTVLAMRSLGSDAADGRTLRGRPAEGLPATVAYPSRSLAGVPLSRRFAASRPTSGLGHVRPGTDFPRSEPRTP